METQRRSQSENPWKDVDNELYQSPVFVIVVFVGLILGGLGMYLVGMFG